MFISRKVAWSAWLVASIFYAYQCMVRIMPNIMLSDIMQQFDIDAVVFGQFSGFYYIGYCLGHIPLGIFLDRYGPKKIMSICILLVVAGILPIIFSEHWIYPIIGRVLIGFGSSAAILGVFKIIRMLFNEKDFTKMLSFSVTIGLIGSIYGCAPIGYFCELYGYKTVLEIFVLLGIIFAAITYIVVPEMKSNQRTTITFDLKTVLANKKVVLICLLAGLLVGPMEGFADAWGSEFFKKVYNLDPQTANNLISMIYVGMCFAPVLSRIAEKTNSYLETIAGAGFIMLISFILLIEGSVDIQSIFILFFIIGICCAYQVLAIYKASTYVPENVAGLTTAVANMTIMSFGYIFHSTIGLVINLYSDINKAFAISKGISIIPITLFLGSLGFIMLAYQEKKNLQKSIA